MYSVGDNVVNSENHLVGSVVQIDEENHKIEIAYQNGGKEWVLQENVKKLLLEIDPPSHQNKLF